VYFFIYTHIIAVIVICLLFVVIANKDDEFDEYAAREMQKKVHTYTLTHTRTNTDDSCFVEYFAIVSTVYVSMSLCTKAQVRPCIYARTLSSLTCLHNHH
jgi:hypothetical protein